jgi:hypothetical protein
VWHSGGRVAQGGVEMERVGWRAGPVRGESRHRERKQRSGVGDKGNSNAAISVEEWDGGEQTPVMVDFVEPTWTERECGIRAV